MIKDDIIEELKKYPSFARTDVQRVMESAGYYISSSIVNHTINQMVAEKRITRKGRNQYVVSTAGCYSYLYSDMAVTIADEIHARHPFLDFRIFELVQLNEFVNHQIANNILFVSVEGGFEADVFNTLWEKHHGYVLLKPTSEDLFRYLAEDLIVITKLPSESPKGISDFWKTRLEKMLVDIAVDKLLRSVVSSGEYPAIFGESLKKYVVDKSTLTRYANRRGSLEKFRLFLKEEAKISEEVFTI